MKSIYFSLIVISSIIFLANRSGRGAVSGNGATTAPGESGTYCGSFGCHFSGSFDPEATIRLLNLDSTRAKTYLPDEKYIIEINTNHSGDPAGYGFQFVALRSSDNSGITGYENLPNRVRAINLADRVYVEHSNIINTNPIYINWESPAEGTGTIDFYAATNVVNGNGSSSGDGSDTTRLSILEEQISSLSTIQTEANILVWPNPATDHLTIDADVKFQSVTLHDLNGKKALESDWSNKNYIDVSHLDPGLYLLILHLPDGKKHTRKLMVR